MKKSLSERIEALEKKVSDLEKENKHVSEKSFGVGNTFQMVGLTWKILDITEQGYMCQAVESWRKVKFDCNSNNWAESRLRRELYELTYIIVNEIGIANIVQFERNLISLDGQTEYGKCTDWVSLLTVDEYRKYRSLLPNTDDYWWWTITPWSTACNDDSEQVTIISPSGGISIRKFNISNGVRPFCVLSPEIVKFVDIQMK